MNIEVIDTESQTVFDEIITGVREYNIEHMGTEKTVPLSVIIRDEKGQLQGGVYGRTIYKNFLIIALWVSKQHRGTGLGRQLMERAELEAIKRGCVVAQLDTLSFQAPIFYQKLGFKIVGTVPAFDSSPARYFMLKQYE